MSGSEFGNFSYKQNLASTHTYNGSKTKILQAKMNILEAICLFASVKFEHWNVLLLFFSAQKFVVIVLSPEKLIKQEVRLQKKRLWSHFSTDFL